MASLSTIAAIAAAQSLPFSLPTRPPITDPMFAASPQRELRRDWDDCIYAMKQVMALNGRGQEEALNWIFNGCEKQESRLTGEMIRQFGYTRGSKAMERARAQIASEIRRQFRPESSAIDRMPGSIVVSGWQVFKKNNACFALKSEDDPPFFPAAMMVKTSDGTIAFSLQSNVGSNFKQIVGNKVVLSLSSIGNGTKQNALGEYTFTLADQVYSNQDGSANYIGIFVTPLSDALLNSIAPADRVQLSVPHGTVIGSSFPVADIRTALAAVRRCSGSNQ